ncbi:MAG: hypothetical protein JNL11_18835 [Bdellovibrionaceae bacterium]|nr:hypothetical protein [Pseudobdellovibrionaceae bacterium]
MSKFELKIDKNADAAKIVIAGTIDEDVDFTQYSLTGINQMEFDLNSVKSINSCGIREWIKWLGTNSKAKMTYINCPKIIIDQINMVDGFLPSNGRVLSFYVPYYNDDSGTEKNVLFRHGTEFGEAGVTPPGKVLDDIGNAMEMDVIESKYFKFLNKK